MQFEIVNENEFLAPIVNKYGAFMPSIHDRSYISAEWFINNGQLESAKRVIKNICDEFIDIEKEMIETNHALYEAEEKVRIKTGEVIDARREAKEYFKRCSNYDTQVSAMDGIIHSLTDEIEMVKSDRAYWQSLYNDEKLYSRRVNEAYDRVNCRNATLEIKLENAEVYASAIGAKSAGTFKEIAGLKKSYGKVKRAMLALKRKVKDLTGLVYTQQQIITEQADLIAKLEREISELNERLGNTAYAEASYRGDEW
jgi:DNA repair exonuclease SbcCD ATPase subunit